MRRSNSAFVPASQFFRVLGQTMGHTQRRPIVPASSSMGRNRDGRMLLRFVPLSQCAPVCAHGRVGAWVWVWVRVGARTRDVFFSLGQLGHWDK